MKAIWNNKTIAESDDTELVEGNHYFPPESIAEGVLEQSDTTTSCAWKGTANYYNIKVDGEVNRDAAWYYAEPKEAAKRIAGRIAFWKGVQVIE